jgi:5-formyltetrahydrofolate cyclo-ligase
VGYGGGYYDRSLALLRARGAVVAVGIGYDFQYCHRVPRSPGDERVDWLVTESALFQFGAIQSGGGAVRRRGRGII